MGYGVETLEARDHASACGHGARGDESHIVAIIAEIDNLVDEAIHALDIESAVGAGEDIGAYLYSNSHVWRRWVLLDNLVVGAHHTFHDGGCETGVFHGIDAGDCYALGGADLIDLHLGMRIVGKD